MTAVDARDGRWNPCILYARVVRDEYGVMVRDEYGVMVRDEYGVMVPK